MPIHWVGGSRIGAMNVGFPLPQVMIQHIQSFLSGKEAARTTILSKSWHSAWSTRPNLDFDQRDFRTDEDGFWAFAKKTMERYEELNLKIETFRLYISARSFSNNAQYTYFIANEWDVIAMLAKELIVKAMKLGTIDFNLEKCGAGLFVLPREVLESKTLIRLRLFGGSIYLGKDRKVSCSVLKSFILKDELIKLDVIWDIVSSCPFIENFVISKPSSSCSYFESVVEAPVNVYNLYKLKSLMMSQAYVDNSFFSDLLFRFPFLKDLTLHYCRGYDYEGIKLRSRSVECISFRENYNNMLRVDCDVPNIRKFEFVAQKVPSLSFKTPSREWESDITIRGDCCCANFFLKLNKLLTCLSSSRITLSLSVKSIAAKEVDFQNLPKTMVENLKMQAPSSVCCALMDCLFWSCRPKFITVDWVFPPLALTWRCCGSDLVEMLCKRLLPGVREDCSITDQNVVVQDLEEVNAERFEETLAEWRPLPWKTLLEDSFRLENKQKVRFVLRWMPDPAM